jgi:hypothetical protein
MPYLRDDELRRLTGFRESAEYELDLCGLDPAHAAASVERMIERSRFRPPRTVTIRMEPPTGEGGETLFQPIGRMLVAAMRAGRLVRCRPLPEPGTGFWIVLTGNPQSVDDTAAD